MASLHACAAHPKPPAPSAWLQVSPVPAVPQAVGLNQPQQPLLAAPRCQPQLLLALLSVIARCDAQTWVCVSTPELL